MLWIDVGYHRNGGHQFEKRTITLIGFRNKDLIFWKEKFERYSDELLIATDDGNDHVRRARPFVEAGLPVFVDKPMAINLCGAWGSFVPCVSVTCLVSLFMKPRAFAMIPSRRTPCLAVSSSMILAPTRSMLAKNPMPKRRA